MYCCNYYLLSNITIGMYPRERSRNRWLVAYTLLRNPSLLSLTASNLTNRKDETRRRWEAEEENVGTSVQVNT